MEVLTGNPAEIRNKIVAERANGLNIQDLFITGMNSHFLTSLPLNWPDPYGYRVYTARSERSEELV